MIPPALLSDSALLAETVRAAAAERKLTTNLLALLGELDQRRLYLGQGYSSLFSYCTQALRLSEHAAYHRIEAARAARQFPVILDRLTDGTLTLTAVGLLRPHLTAENHLALLDAARYQSKREIERLIAALNPKAPVAPMIRRLAILKPLSIAPRGDIASTAAVVTARSIALQATRPTLESRVQRPSPGDSYLLRLTIAGDTYAKLQRARDLLSHTIPNGDPAAIVDRALTVLVEQLERTKLGATPRPRPTRDAAPTRRHIPAAVRRAVWSRDGGRCTFVGTAGRCMETSRLEFHHVTPYARGGPTDAANLTLRCRAHNAFDARLEFGDRWP